MDHNQAIQGGFAERYLLGELKPAERELFEEHFFECSICADDIEAGAVFIDNARAELRHAEAAGATKPWRSRFGIPFQSAAFATVLLVFVVGYQNLVTIPGLHNKTPPSQAAESANTVSLVGIGARAETKPVTLSSHSDTWIKLEVPGSPDFKSYWLRMRDAARQVQVQYPIGAESVKNEVKLWIPGSALAPGTYEVEISASAAPGQPEAQLLHFMAFVQ